MRYVESPNEIPEDAGSRPSVFLAGGITGCPDWQSDVADALTAYDAVVLNPRREDFPIHDPASGPAQIEWEHRMLREADLVSFWFCAETLQPIVLYELGAWSMTKKPIIVGVHPDYPRRQDVEIQTALARPRVKLVNSTARLIDQVADFLTANG